MFRSSLKFIGKTVLATAGVVADIVFVELNGADYLEGYELISWWLGEGKSVTWKREWDFNVKDERIVVTGVFDTEEEARRARKSGEYVNL